MNMRGDKAMKKYTVTLDERQMEMVTIAMQSQMEIAYDVATDAREDAQKYDTDGNKRKFEDCATDYFVAVGINDLLRDATPNTDEGRVISSKEFATDVSDYIDEQVQSALEIIARELWLNGYLKEQPCYGDFEESAYGIRDGFISFLQDMYGLVKSDGKEF
jgi:hypothetical protein